MMRPHRRLSAFIGGFALLICLLPLAAQAARTAEGKKAMAATAHPLASEAAVRVMQKGGNAADAFVAAALTLGVVEPYSAGLGGGGFLLYRDKEGRVYAYDFRERAPSKAGRDLFLKDGAVEGSLSKEGPLAVGVPGQPAGLDLVLQKHGRLPRAELAKDALHYAREGFEVYPYLKEKIEVTKERLEKFPATKKIWLPQGKVPAVGEKIRQRDLALALEAFAKEGAAPFYTGKIAKAMVKELNRLGGIFSAQDLTKYEVYEEKPLRGTYKDWDLYTFPPPSSGGVGLLQMLGMVEASGADLRLSKPKEPGPHWPMEAAATHAHLLAEIMRRAYADRSEHLGDPRFSRIPVLGLLDPAYLKKRMASYDPKHATDMDAGSPAFQKESEHTTHLSIVGPEGDAVSATLTINLPFGSGVTVPGWGILLNNEMDDFTAAPGVPNAFGLIQGEKNAVAGGKTPLSSMTPTIALQGGKLRFVLGTPGGSRIISTIFQVFLDVAGLGLTPKEAVDLPRTHHQWRPDLLMVEEPYLPFIEKALTGKGHSLKAFTPWCNVQAVWVEEGGALLGLSDERVAGEPRGF